MLKFKLNLTGAPVGEIMKVQKFWMVILLIVAMFVVSPVMAGNDNGQYPNGNDCHGNDCNQQPIDVDVTVPVTVNEQIDVDNYNANFNVNLNKNYNENNNYNDNVNNNYNDVNVVVKPPVNNNFNFDYNDVDVDNTFSPDIDVEQSQKQNQNQIQLQVQDQNQKQQQSQNNVQTVIVPLPQDANGILISDTKSSKVAAQLDVGESQVFSRLVYPGEVLTYEVASGDKISMRSASDVGLYTIGWSSQDDLKVGCIEAIPGYDPIAHKLVFGFVVPVDKINYWTTKATLVASGNAHYVVIDNRAPRNGYTHVEITIESGEPLEEPIKELPKIVIKPSVYPVDAYGRAITS